MVNVLVRRSENLCHGLDSHSQVNSPGIGKLQIFATLASTSVEILKDVGIPDRLTCLLQNLYAGQDLNCQHLLDHQKSKRVTEKHLLLLY